GSVTMRRWPRPRPPNAPQPPHQEHVMPTGVFDSPLLGHVWGTDELRAIFSDENRVQKWFDYEAALALAQAELGIVPPAAAAEIAARAKVANVDLAAIGAEIRRIKHPLVPALRALQAACADDHGEYLHFGPTTQDVLDTGMVLQLKEAHAIILRDLRRVGRELLRLAETHKATPMAGRTHGVQALPITFGHKSAIWLAQAWAQLPSSGGARGAHLRGQPHGRGRHAGLVRRTRVRARRERDGPPRSRRRRHLVADSARPSRRIRGGARPRRRRARQDRARDHHP